MQGDKQNNQIRSAIDGLEQLPEGFSFNSQRVWTGIEEKLPGEKQKKATWYYAAAAAVLLMGASYFVFLSPSIKNNIEPKATIAELKKTSFAEEKQNKSTVSGIDNISQEKKSIRKKTTGVKTVIASPPIKETMQLEENKMVVVSSAEPVVLFENKKEPIKEEKNKPAATVAKKTAVKKFRIIHLNDLDALPATNDNSNLTKSELRKMMNQQIEEKELAQPSETNSKSLYFFKTKPANTSTNTIVENN